MKTYYLDTDLPSVEVETCIKMEDVADGIVPSNHQTEASVGLNVHLSDHDLYTRAEPITGSAWVYVVTPACVSHSGAPLVTPRKRKISPPVPGTSTEPGSIGPTGSHTTDSSVAKRKRVRVKYVKPSTWPYVKSKEVNTEADKTLQAPATGSAKIQCKVCDNTFNTFMDRKQHMELMHKDNKCKICKNFQATTSELEAHYNWHKDRSKANANRLCHVCGKSVKTCSYKKHMKVHGAQTTSELKAHYNWHKERSKVNATRLCHVCGKSVKTFSYKKHIESHGAQMHACKVCDFKTNYPFTFKLHMRRHNNDRPFACDTCGRAFVSKEELSIHLVVHSNDRSFACPRCNSTFKHQKYLSIHVRSVHGITSTNVAPIVCPVCNLRCRSKERLSEHMNTHTGDRPHSCNMCEKTFRTRKTMHEHKRTIHCDQLLFPCDKCEKRYASKAGVTAHNRLAHSIQGDEEVSADGVPLSEAHKNVRPKRSRCKDMAIPSTSDEQDNQVDDNNDEISGVTAFKIVPCIVCANPFNTVTHRRQHMEQNHQENKCKICKVFQATTMELDAHYKRHEARDKQRANPPLDFPQLCPICGKSCMTSNSYAQHMLVHGPRMHVCKICDFKTNYLRTFTIHMRRHNNDCPFMCETCGRAYVTKDALTVHLRVHSDDRPHACTHCSWTFKHKNSLTIHERGVHGITSVKGQNDCVPSTLSVSATASDPTIAEAVASIDRSALTPKKCDDKVHSPQMHACDMCDYKSRYLLNLTEHVRIHNNDRPFMCDTCGRVFISQTELSGHQIVHSDDKPVACTHCDSTYKHMKQLRKHERVTHGLYTGNVTPNICSVCNLRFPSKQKLSDHMNIHTGVRPYSCTMCEKTFRSQPTMEKHILTHANHKLFACDLCDKKYSVKRYLKTHNKKHHENKKPLLFPCDHCWKHFDSKQGVTTHKRVVHSIRGDYI